MVGLDWSEVLVVEEAQDVRWGEARVVGTYEGYVSAWVSDGRSMVNVLVTGDPEQAHSDFRDLWPGGCV